MAAVFAVLLVFAVINFKRARGVFILCLAFILVAFARYYPYMQSLQSAERLVGQKCEITAQISDVFFYSDSDKARYAAKVISAKGENIDAENFGLAIYTSFKADYEIGDKISFTAKIRPSSETSRLSRASGYPLSVNLYNEDLVSCEKAEKKSIFYFAYQIRGAIKEANNTYLNKSAAAAENGILLGDTSALSAEQSRIFRITGMSHIMSVSGMHIAFLVSAIYFLFGRIVRIKKRFIAAIILLAVFAFSVVVGFSPSVQRAGLMVAILYIGMLLDERAMPVNSLFYALAVILIISPYSINSISLQLSATSVFGIVLFGETLNNFLQRKFGKGKIKRYIIGAASVSVSAMIFVAPLLAYYFGEVPLFSAVAMLLTGFVIEIIFILSIILSVFSFAPFIPFIFGKLINLLYMYTETVLKIISKIPYAAVPAQYGFFPIVFVFIAVLIFLTVKFKIKRAKLLIPVFAAAVVIGVAIFTYKPFNALIVPEETCLVSFYDVGQGDSAAIQNGNEVVLIDAGGSGYNIAELISRNFKSKGAARVKAIILTHYHSDHANAVSELLDEIAVDELYMPDAHPEDPIRKSIEEAAKNKNIKINYLSSDVSIEPMTGLNLEIFAGHISSAEYADKNEACLVVKADYMGSSVLFTGDIDEAAEQILIKSGKALDVDLLKVAHHGSKYSSGLIFLSGVTPDAAVISVSKDNSYGHPADETIERLGLYTDYIYRTDISGTIEFLTRNGSFVYLG